MLRLNGITPVMATTFREDDSIDFEALCRQIDHAIEGGASAICGPGYGSEFYKLSDEERRRYIEVLVTHTKRRVPVIAATSSGSTRTTIEFSQYAEKIGADMLMIVAPKTAALPSDSILAYFSSVCDAVKIPVMLQDADFTGAGMPARVFVELARKHPNFAFAKLEVILPGTKCHEIVEQSKGQVQVIYGYGGLTMLDGLAHGASAIMPGAACIEVYDRIYRLFQGGRKDEALQVFSRLLPYLSFAMQHLEIGFYMEKRVMYKRGILPNTLMRRPSLTLDPIYEAQVDDLVDWSIALIEECREANLGERQNQELKATQG